MTKVRQKGTQLLLGDGAATENFTEIAQLSNIGGINMENVVEEVTTHDDAGRWVNKLAGLLNPGAVECEGFWDPANATHDSTDGIYSKFADGGVHNFQMTFPQFDTPPTFSFAAIVSSISFGGSAVDGVGMPISFTLEITGAVTES